jgi:hypothetical protein
MQFFVEVCTGKGKNADKQMPGKDEGGFFANQTLSYQLISNRTAVLMELVCWTCPEKGM